MSATGDLGQKSECVDVGGLVSRGRRRQRDIDQARSVDEESEDDRRLSVANGVLECPVELVRAVDSRETRLVAVR